jgi:transcriptional regulator with XRE-family HTH domain
MITLKPTKPPKKSPQFAMRLVQSCDDHATCPSLNQGRLGWLRKRLADDGLFVSAETIRKWLSGEGRPRLDKVEKIAKALEVDPQWLYMGPRSAAQYRLSATNENVEAPSVQIEVRPGTIIEVRGLPLDLTQTEANRVAKIILAHVVDDENDPKLCR